MMESTNTKSTFAEYTKMLTQFKLPGIDVAPVLESRRKDIGALVAANTTALAGIQALGQKQVEILHTAMTELQSLVTRSATSESKPAAGKSEQVQSTLHWAMTNIQEIIGTAYKTQSDTFAIVSKRVAENVEELKALVHSTK
ncbi:phasin [Caballeronia choica]|jgi:phasin family protein|uniref:Phasin n=2 Tax=Caballeronia choica TaxID=326476 RepID=A0A158KN27_9BURK|nr:phasin [Caballeronia choica]